MQIDALNIQLSASISLHWCGPNLFAYIPNTQSIG